MLYIILGFVGTKGWAAPETMNAQERSLVNKQIDNRRYFTENYKITELRNRHIFSGMCVLLCSLGWPSSLWRRRSPFSGTKYLARRL